MNVRNALISRPFKIFQTQADFLVHVVDASHAEADTHVEAVNSVLREIGAEGKPTLMVFNKADQLRANHQLSRFLERHPNGVAVSAISGEGIEELLAELGVLLRPVREFLELAIPHGKASVISRMHEVGQVVETSYDDAEVARFKVRIPPHLHHEFKPFVVRELQTA